MTLGLPVFPDLQVPSFISASIYLKTITPMFHHAFARAWRAASLATVSFSHLS
jgi:hypothetical protein